MDAGAPKVLNYNIIAINALTTSQFLSTALRTSNLRMSFNFDKAVNTLSSNKILTKVLDYFFLSAVLDQVTSHFFMMHFKTSQLGLLSRLEKAGFTLTSAIPLLKLADEKDLIGVLEASSDNVLPLIGKAIDLSPALLPVAATALSTPPTVLFGGAAASLAAAGLLIATVPDDSVLDIAVQVALGIPLATILPVALGVGGVVLSKLK